MEKPYRLKDVPPGVGESSYPRLAFFSRHGMSVARIADLYACVEKFELFFLLISARAIL